jgi:hypothetical protein
MLEGGVPRLQTSIDSAGPLPGQVSVFESKGRAPAKPMLELDPLSFFMTPSSAWSQEWDPMVLEDSSASATPFVRGPLPQTWDPMSLEEVLPRLAAVVVMG